MTNPARRTAPHPALPRSRPPHAGAPEESTWSTRSAASMNDVDPDKHRHTLTAEEGPPPATTSPNSPAGAASDHRHNAHVRESHQDPAAIHHDLNATSGCAAQGPVPPPGMTLHPPSDRRHAPATSPNMGPAGGAQGVLLRDEANGVQTRPDEPARGDWHPGPPHRSQRQLHQLQPRPSSTALYRTGWRSADYVPRPAGRTPKGRSRAAQTSSTTIRSSYSK
jgi:hypothetical protein